MNEQLYSRFIDYMENASAEKLDFFNDNEILTHFFH